MASVHRHRGPPRRVQLDRELRGGATGRRRLHRRGARLLYVLPLAYPFPPVSADRISVDRISVTHAHCPYRCLPILCRLTRSVHFARAPSPARVSRPAHVVLCVVCCSFVVLSFVVRVCLSVCRRVHQRVRQLRGHGARQAQGHEHDGRRGLLPGAVVRHPLPAPITH
jgi:hypothetical protein